MRLFITFLTIGIFSFAYQQEFEGIVQYKIDYPEMMLNSFPSNIKDSAQIAIKLIKGKNVRTESFSKMGKQSLLVNIESDTSYLLMDLYGKKLALQMVDPNPNTKKNDSLKLAGNAGKVFGFKSKKATYTKHGKEYTIIYCPQISSKYGTSFTSLNGLALVFPIVLNEMDALIYTCESIQETTISDSYFEIPSDHEVLTMEQFYQMINGGGGQ